MLCVSNFKRAFCCLLIITLVCTVGAPAVSVHGAGNFSDIKGHWAENYIREAVAKGYVGGYPDGTFQPNKAITRAEFCHMINAALGNKGMSDIAFSDVPQSEWYYDDVRKAVSGTFVSGYEDKTFRPNNPITRQEAAVVLARIVPVTAQKGNLTSFPDYKTVSDWAAPSFARINAKGYIGTYNDGKLHPMDSLTRAQTAKIICDLVDKESIVKDDPKISDSNTRYTGKIFTNGVTIEPALGNGTVFLDQCVILGNLSVNGGGENSVNVSNSRVLNTNVSRSSGTVRLVVSGESNFMNLSVDKQATIQTSALTGGDFGPGISNVDVKKDATVLFSGNFPKINLTGSSEITVTAGQVDQLTVSANAPNSDITVESTATLKNAEVDASAAFHGYGFIRNMTVNANGVTYAKKPDSIILGSNITDINQNRDIDIDPRLGATSVSPDTNITLTFGDRMNLYNGNTIYNSDIGNFVELRQDSTSGKLVSFSGSIDSAKKVITIQPDTTLNGNTKYYVLIRSNALKDSQNNGNSSFTSYFTTSEGSGISIDPKNGASNVSLSSNIQLTFQKPMQMYNGNTLTNSRAEDVIELRRGSASGKLVDFNATVSSSEKVITIEPNSNLADDERYYVILDKNQLKDFDDNGNPAFSSYFNTGNDTNNGYVSIDPKNGSTNVSIRSDITLTFDKPMHMYNGNTLTDSRAGDVIELRQGSSSGRLVSYTASVSSSKRVITIDPDSNLSDDERYYVSIDRNQLKDSDDNGNPSISSYFSTGNDEGDGYVSIDPRRGASNVSLRSDITLTFNNPMRMYNGNTLTGSRAEDVIELRQGSSSGRLISFSASVNSSKRVITIDPDSNLSDDTRYYVRIDRNQLRDSNGDGNPSFESYFSTGSDSDDYVSIDPRRGASNVSTRSDITLTFDRPMRMYNGNTLTDSRAADVINLRQGSSSGKFVSFSASVNSNKNVITIDPDYNLSDNTAYYVTIDRNQLKDSNGYSNPYFESYFNTGNVANNTNSISLNNPSLSSNSNSITANVNGNTSGTVYAILLTGTTPDLNASQIITDASSKQTSVSSGSTASLTWTGLAPNTSYKVCAVLKSGSDTSDVRSATIKTGDLGQATLNGLTVAPDVGGSIKPGIQSIMYATNLPSNTKNVTVTASVNNGISVSINGANANSATFALTGDNIMEVPIKLTGTNYTPNSYTLNLRAPSNTNLLSGYPKVTDGSGNSIPQSNGSYQVPASVSAVKVEVQTVDPSASITLDHHSGTGTLTTTLSSPTSNYSITVNSRGVPKDYNLSFTKLTK